MPEGASYSKRKYTRIEQGIELEKAGWIPNHQENRFGSVTPNYFVDPWTGWSMSVADAWCTYQKLQTKKMVKATCSFCKTRYYFNGTPEPGRQMHCIACYRKAKDAKRRENKGKTMSVTLYGEEGENLEAWAKTYDIPMVTLAKKIISEWLDANPREGTCR